MKKPRLLGAVCAIVFTILTNSTNADVVITDQIENRYDVNGVFIAGTVDFWSFSATGSPVTFNIFAYGFGNTWLDSSIWLFSDDGVLDASDLLAENNDSSAAGWALDGSTDTTDSFLSIALAPGNYILAVGRCCTSTMDILDGLLYEEVNNNTNPVESEVPLHYQLTITGDVSMVPIPPALWLFSSGLLGLVGIARRKQAA